MRLFESPLLHDLFAAFPHLERWRRRAAGSVLDSVRTMWSLPSSPAGISAALRRRMIAAASKVLGPETAVLLEKQLSASPHVLMAHHHGINCHPEFIQSTLMAALPAFVSDAKSSAALPVLACSSVALRSFSFPRGLVLARPDARGALTRLPLFPASAGDLLVRNAPPLTLKHLTSALSQWKKKDLQAEELRSATDLVEEYLMRPDVLALPSYSQQITRVNAAVWRGLCGEKAPPLVFLDLEEMTSQLLKDALLEEDSLFYRLLFHVPARRALCAALAGVPGCRPAPADEPSGGAGNRLDNGVPPGTDFFWLVKNGQRRPLALREKAEPALVYQDTVIPFTRDALLEGLEKRQILPGLYCSCILLAHVHGLTPHGGVYMCDYAPRMQRATDAVIRAFDLSGSGAAAAPGAPEPLRPLPVLATAFMPLRAHGHRERALGLTELLRHRAALPEALRRVGNLPAARVCLFAFADWWLEITAGTKRRNAWQELLSAMLNAAQGSSVVSSAPCRNTANLVFDEAHHSR